VLVDALAAGRPVVATAFPHAVELLASGAGLVVPHGDAAALSNALRRVLTEPGFATSMEKEAARLGPAFSWRSVASQYARLADEILLRSKALPA
jgi:polysaccharide biosynthesis protein PslF